MIEAVGREVEPAGVGQTVLTAVCGHATPPEACHDTVVGLAVVLERLVVERRVVDVRLVRRVVV